MSAQKAYSVWRDLHDPRHQDLGNAAAFASLNALAATYAVVAFIGIRPLVVDTWLGLVERLYVTEKPARVSRRRVAAVAAPTPLARPWDEVLFRGSAATASGAHLTESAGAFRVVTKPASPVGSVGAGGAVGAPGTGTATPRP